MGEPCVKGTLFQNLALELIELIKSGRLDDALVSELLKPEEQELLDREISISSWFPVELYCRMLKLYARSAAGCPSEFLIESGRHSARRVIELGIYSQLDDRTEESWENRVGRILVTLSGSFFDFGRWEWQGLDGDGFTIRVADAAPMSDELTLRTGGFIEHLAERAAGCPIALTRERSHDGSELVYRAHRIS